MPNNPVILVEDDDSIAELIRFNLQNEGYVTERYASFESLEKELPRLENDGAALFVLDIMLPGVDGFEICAKLRASPAFEMTPILMLTARGSENDKVRGFETGADDYLTKPFGIREFLSRARSLIRRYGKITAFRDRDGEEGQSDRTVLTAGNVILDDARHRVFVGSAEVELTNREYELLKFLMLNRGIAFSRDELLDHVWGFDYVGETRTVDVHVRQLRKKLEVDEKAESLIETVRGRGYRLSEKTT
jgi:two-component system alkaline phosphatase synthesis response regulator PhoP